MTLQHRQKMQLLHLSVAYFFKFLVSQTLFNRLCSIFGLWITYSTIYPGFKMATIFWICCVKTVRHPNDPPKKLLFNLAVTKLLAVKIVGKCQIAPLNSIFWVFKMKFLKKKFFLKNFENIF